MKMKKAAALILSAIMALSIAACGGGASSTGSSDSGSGSGSSSGGLTINGYTTGYDLRYASGDLHRVMLEEYFGKGLVKATEIR